MKVRCAMPGINLKCSNSSEASSFTAHEDISTSMFVALLFSNFLQGMGEERSYMEMETY